jgi:Flp pilus assembly protein TadG
MRRGQKGQALVEWAVSAFVVLLFALSILAVGQLVGEDMAVRAAASQAAFAAARAPSEADAQTAGQAAAAEAVRNSGLRQFTLRIDTGGFQRGGVLTVTARGCADLSAFPIVTQYLGQCPKMTWTAHALIEPYRSRSGP